MKKVVIKDREWKRIKRQLSRAASRAAVKIGVLASKGGNQRGRDKAGKFKSASSGSLTLVEIAAIHEFGSPAAGIPERSFIRKTFDDRRAELRAIMMKQARAVITKAMPIDKALGLIGIWGSAQVKNTIAEGAHLTPALADSTVARKKSKRPLVDTGRLVGSINHEVVD